jgi:hypothetical protein
MVSSCYKLTISRFDCSGLRIDDCHAETERPMRFSFSRLLLFLRPLPVIRGLSWLLTSFSVRTRTRADAIIASANAAAAQASAALAASQRRTRTGIIAAGIAEAEVRQFLANVQAA